ncbi:MBL fold metallo-hydrolase [Bosea sp. BH3]|uniref:MBL fold metallo-hydrolase n=1 Tax=Bosea sp. BH3 TaxID=2871701 RepID=UPI0021CB566B|nr:MBL fold metallo-hydrolase [Bosea sp. BH3]MCU4180788.1 MBL fold metallo-hydrolase [Bosea sp. BH3]
MARPTIRAAILRLCLFLLAALALGPSPASAQTDEPGCRPEMASLRLPLHRANLAKDEVRLTFVGHATFLIETPGGVKIATDYNDYVRPPVTPDIATMNKAHSTHNSRSPDPAIRHVLPGWDTSGQGAAKHDLTFGDIRVRNVPTNIRDYAGGTDYDGNSMFVFEIGDLCIAHLGHLHHPLEPGHLRALGRVDVVLFPVDGSYTLDQEGMLQVLKSLQARIMIPMHFFGGGTLNRFLARTEALWPVERRERPVITVSKATLPATPKMIVLPGH